MNTPRWPPHRLDNNYSAEVVPQEWELRSNAWKWKVKVKPCLTLSDPMDCSPPGSSVHGFSRQEYWSGVPLPSPEGRYTYIYMYTVILICDVVWQKPTQHCKATILQLKIIKIKWKSGSSYINKHEIVSLAPDMTWRFAGSCVSEKILGQEFSYTAEIYEVVAHPRMES